MTGWDGTLGEFLQQARRAAGLTQEELAGKAGLSVRAISDLERGRTAAPRRSSLQLLVAALELPESAYAQFLAMFPGLLPSDPQGHSGSAGPNMGLGVGADVGSRHTDNQPVEMAAAGALTSGLYAITPVRVNGGAAAAAPMVAVPAQLPTDISDFTGRARQVVQLRGLLAGWRENAGLTRDGRPSPPSAQRPGEGNDQKAVPVVLVMGAGGLGKTTLAIHAAHEVAPWFPDGQLHAHLTSATQPVDPAEVLARFLRDLGMDAAGIPANPEERAARYRTLLAGRRVLIVLDDARDAAQVLPLLPGDASCAVLITTRGQIPDLAGARTIDLDLLPHEDAHALFSQVTGWERVSAEPAATEDVLGACAGLPLAIRIAGARLAARGSWTVRALADRLADERRRLDVLQTGNLAVRASFEVSFASLPGPATPGGVDPAGAFRLLGLWTGPSVSLAAASALLGEDEDAVTDALDVLVDAHLLESPAPDRYRFHDLLRVYAADRARTQEPEPDRQAAITRILTWYLHTTEAAAQIISRQRRQVPLDPAPPLLHPLRFDALDEALAWCETEQSGLMAATMLAGTSGLHEMAWKLPAAAMIFYFRRSHWADWAATHEVGLASARASGDRLAEAWMLNNLGMAYGVQRKGESVGYLEQALALSRELGNVHGEAQAATNLANSYFQLGSFEEARTAAQRSVAIERSMGDRFGTGTSLGILGSACRELGRFREAIAFLDEALVMARELGDRALEAVSLSDLGEAYLGLGRLGDATSRLEESMAIWESLKERNGRAAALHTLGQVQWRAGNFPRAHALLTEAITLYDGLGDHSKAAEVRASLAEQDS